MRGNGPKKKLPCGVLVLVLDSWFLALGVVSEKISIFSKNSIMGVTITNSTIDKYFGFLKRLDNNSTKRLIVKLTESIETDSRGSFSLTGIYGAWEDTKDSDEIIAQIRNSRINNRDIEEL